MADRPFMQLYGSDLVGDTLHLSAEQIGAYMLLLIAMWNAGGSLPANDAKLARIARCTPARWLKISADLLELFEANETEIWHKRQRKELAKYDEKREKNARSGSLGGIAKALKDKETPVANANKTPRRKAGIVRATPETITRIEEREADASPKNARGSRLPADWQIPNEWGKWACDEFGVGPKAVRAEADRFRDYWIAKTGAQATKLDWLATWRNWCRTAFAVRQPASQAPRQPTSADIGRKLLEDMQNGSSGSASAVATDYPAARQLSARPES